MTAHDLLDDVRRRGVHLSVEHDRLVYLGVSGALSKELRETIAAHKEDLIDLLRSHLPPRVGDWPEAWREAYEERASIKEFDGGTSRDEAERSAEAEIRRLANLGAHGEQLLPRAEVGIDSSTEDPLPGPESSEDPASPPSSPDLDVAGNMARRLGLSFDDFERVCRRMLSRPAPATREEDDRVRVALEPMLRWRGWTSR